MPSPPASPRRRSNKGSLIGRPVVNAAKANVGGDDRCSVRYRGDVGELSRPAWACPHGIRSMTAGDGGVEVVMIGPLHGSYVEKLRSPGPFKRSRQFRSGR